MDLTQALSSPATQVGDCVFEISPDFRPGMQAPVRFIVDEAQLDARMHAALAQLIELAQLPQLGDCVLGLPNADRDQGFPVGAALSMRYPDGMILPAAAGSEGGCGLRLLTSPLTERELSGR